MQDGVQFNNALAHSPQTLPSHTSIMTGTYPSFHQVQMNGSFFDNENIVTLAQELKDNGYETAAFISAFVLDTRFGLNKGFNHYDNAFESSEDNDMFGYQQCTAEKVLDHVTAWFEDFLIQGNDIPFFTWIHLFDPHRDYEPPEPYRSEYPDKLYDGEIAYVDSQLGRLVDYLKQKELYDNTLIIVTSDHGESLGEHDEQTHSIYIYRATQHIPLIIKFPEQKYAKTKIPDLVRHIDLVPTVFEILGMKPDKINEQLQGSSLISLIQGPKEKETGRISYAESFYPFYNFGWCPPKSYEDERYKFIDLPQPELYDLSNDPNELSNVYEDNIILAKKLRQRIKDISARRSEHIALSDNSAETLQKFETLGYIGSIGSAGKDPKDLQSCIDPKNEIKSETILNEAENLVRVGLYDKALKVLDELTQQNPNNLKARWDKANIFFLQKENDKALEELIALKEVKKDYTPLYIQLANLYLHQYNDSEKAKKEIENAFAITKNDPMIWTLKGDLESRKGNFIEALDSYNKAEALGEKSADFLQSKGALLLNLQKFDEAESYLQRAVQYQVDHAEAYFDLGVLYKFTGQKDEALKAFHLALAFNDTKLKYYSSLADLYLSQNAYSKSIGILNKALQRDRSNPAIYYNLGTTYLLWGKPDQAIKLLKQTVALDAGYGPAFSNLGLAYQNTKDYSSAYVAFQKSVELMPDEAKYWLNLAKAALELNKTDEIKKYLQIAIKKGMEVSLIRSDERLSQYLP